MQHGRCLGKKALPERLRIALVERTEYLYAGGFEALDFKCDRRGTVQEGDDSLSRIRSDLKFVGQCHDVAAKQVCRVRDQINELPEFASREWRLRGRGEAGSQQN